MSEIPIIERAIELAKAGACRDIPDIERKLAVEGYASISAYLSGTSFRKQLRQLIRMHPAPGPLEPGREGVDERQI